MKHRLHSVLHHALVMAACALLTPPASAHKPSDAYLNLTVEGTQIEQRLDVALRDLDRDLDLDADRDGQLTWGEVRRRWADVEQLVARTVRLEADGRACAAGAQPGPAQLDEHSDGRYAVLTRTWHCDAPVRALAVTYGLFQASDPTHRGILRVQQAGADGAGAAHTAVIEPGTAPARFELGTAPSAPLSALGFLAEGVHHILIGVDHVLFLMALLLPAVLVRNHRDPVGGAPSRVGPAAAPGLWRVAWAHARPAPSATAFTASASATAPPERWRGAPALRPVLLDVLRVVTAFTLAHSITLALAALDVLDPPSRWVESIIAASVVLAALNNLRPLVQESRWLLTFGFGLVHGFGFAGALKDLGLEQGSLVGPLLGFNLGVELGQLAIVALFVPLAWWGRHSAFYRRVVVGGGSWSIALIALIWLVERAFDVQLLAAA